MNCSADSPTERLHDLLVERGPMTLSMMAQALESKAGSVRNSLGGLVRRGDVGNVGSVPRGTGHGGMQVLWGVIDKPIRNLDVAGITAAALAARTDLERAWT